MYVSPRPRRATPGDCAACAAACPDSRCCRPPRRTPTSPRVTRLPPPPPPETQLGTPSPALVAATTHARFSPSCDFFFPSEPSSVGGVSLSVAPPRHCLLFFSPSSPSPAWCVPLSSVASLRFYLFIFIWLPLSRSRCTPPSLRIPALSPEWRVPGSAAGQA